mmetsp:Transcript_83201/g.165165  ORF Transcript_83201/g.165165 Transcript_83201/m.165165 type:complete len:196 (+) Transcript_83201:62-649(+)
MFHWVIVLVFATVAATDHSAGSADSSPCLKTGMCPTMHTEGSSMVQHSKSQGPSPLHTEVLLSDKNKVYDTSNISEATPTGSSKNDTSPDKKGIEARKDAKDSGKPARRRRSHSQPESKSDSNKGDGGNSGEKPQDSTEKPKDAKMKPGGANEGHADPSHDGKANKNAATTGSVHVGLMLAITIAAWNLATLEID